MLLLLTCSGDGMDRTRLTACAWGAAADDTEVVGGATRRPLPQMEVLVAGNVLGERYPLPDGSVLDDEAVDRDGAVPRRQPGDRQPAVLHQLGRHVERRIWLRTCSIRCRHGRASVSSPNPIHNTGTRTKSDSSTATWRLGLCKVSVFIYLWQYSIDNIFHAMYVLRTTCKVIFTSLCNTSSTVIARTQNTADQQFSLYYASYNFSTLSSNPTWPSTCMK